MKDFDSRTYSINDFREWHEAGDKLRLSPKFQRRSVWTDSAKSYLMDTIIRGKPIPKIFIRQEINPRTKKTVREVVDGQQRLRAILEFVSDGFKISKAHNQDYGGKYFSQLSDMQNQILKYELSVDLLLDATDADVLDIFSRLNTYSVKLVKQELIHAKYFGEFKQSVYELALEYLNFWRDNRIFTDAKILRMAEAELTSDLLIAMTEGIKSKKQIEVFYKKYEEKGFPNRKKTSDNFKKTMDSIGELMNGTLSASNFRRPHVFYSLFCSIFHFQQGIPDLSVKRKAFSKKDYPKVRQGLDRIDALFEKEDLSREESKFMQATRRATTDAAVRVFRSEFICGYISKALAT